MTTVRDILQFVQTIAPPELAESWDNNGLLCGRLDKPVDRVLVALDPFMYEAEEARHWGAQVLLTHHPLIFRPVSSVTDQTAVGRTLMYLIEYGIAAINAHTSLDYAPGGVNDVLAQRLGLSEITGGGLWRGGVVEPQSLRQFVPHVKQRLGALGVRVGEAWTTVHRVAVCGGAGMSCLPEIVAAGYDTFVTGDAKYNDFFDAVDQGVNLIDAGHFPTEHPICAVLAEKVAAAFPSVEVRISTRLGDVIRFW